ncbi:MAG: ABC transporter substrate-binding protein [Bacteroidota bacterium]
MNRTPYQLAFGLLLFLSFVFYACPPSSGGGAVDEPTVDFKNRDNTLRVRLAAEPDRLNPFLTTSAYARSIYEQLFLPLLETNKKDFSFRPALAVGRPEIQDVTEGPFAGGVSYTYELVESATFSDGHPVEVEDVIYTFKAPFNQNIAEAIHIRASLDMVADVYADPANDRRFTVVTDRKYILTEDAISTTFIFPEHVFDPEGQLRSYSLANLKDEEVDQTEDATLVALAEQFLSAPFSRSPEKLIGAGPYVLRDWEDGQYITMARNPDWWVDKQPENRPELHAYPDSLVFRIITDQVTTIGAMKSELVDLIPTIDATTFVEERQNEYLQERFTFETPSTFNLFYLALNNRDPLLEDKRVRRALAHVLDVESIIELAYAGLGTRLNGPTSPRKPTYNSDLAPIEKDLELAQELLAAAGWEDTNGDGVRDQLIDGERREMELELLYPPGTQFGEALANVMKDGAEQAGVAVSLVPRGMRAMLGEDVASRDYQMYAGASGGYHQIDDYFSLWHTSSNTARGQNRWQFGNAQTDALIEEINRTLDGERRMALYHQFQEIVYDEQPIIFLLSPQERIAISKRFTGGAGLEVTPNYDVRDFQVRNLE